MDRTVRRLYSEADVRELMTNAAVMATDGAVVRALVDELLAEAATGRREADMSRATPEAVAKLRVTVEDENGEVVYATWQEAEGSWRNCFLRFGEREEDLLGQPIDSSYWDTPDPIETYRDVELLERIVREVVRVNDSAGGAVGDVRSALGEEAANRLARVVAGLPGA